MCAYNPNISEAEVRGLWVEDQPEPHNESSSLCNIIYLVVLGTEPRASYVLDNVCTPACVLSPLTLVFDINLAKLSREALNFGLSSPSMPEGRHYTSLPPSVATVSLKKDYLHFLPSLTYKYIFIF